MSHIHNNHPNLKWVCHTRADMINECVVEAMAASHCVEVQIGVESGSQEILTRMGKSLELESIRRAFALLNKEKIRSWATFVIGNDGETLETVRQSVQFAIEINPSYASFIIVLPFPGNRIYEIYKQKGYIKAKSWSEYSWHSSPVFETDQLKRENMEKMRRLAWFKFYIRPAKLISIFLDVIRARSLREVWRSFGYWMSLVIKTPR